MKALITGGAGYIGSHCGRLFARKGVQVVSLDDLSDGHREAVTAGRLVIGSYGDKALLGRLMDEEKFDAVIHFAAFASVPDSVTRPDRYYRNNVTNMQTLLDAAVAHGIKCFVFSSSAATFGEPQYIPIDEAHPQNPINPYGATKRIGERMLADYARAYGLRYCAFRYFNAAGASPEGDIGESHDPECHLIPRMLRAIKSGEPMQVYGTDYDTRDGSCLRDYVHVEDLAEAHYLGMRYILDGNPSECFNLGSGEGFTVIEMLEAAEAVTGRRVPHTLAGRREGDPAKLVASNEKAKALLGWELTHSDIHTILRDAWNWEEHKRY